MNVIQRKKKYINDVVDGAAWFETRVCLYYIMYLCVVNRACYRSIKSIIYESRLCGGGGASWNKKKLYSTLVLMRVSRRVKKVGKKRN